VQTRTWTIETTCGHTTTGYLPAWAEDDPSETGVPLERLGVSLADICHHAPFSGQLLPVSCDSSPGRPTVILFGSINCNPYDEDSELRVPVVNLQIVDDYWSNGLDPTALADVAAKLRAQADRLDHEILPALIAARADWNAQHTT
jgi:hypothetical protein